MDLTPEEIDRHVGSKLRFLRELHGISQAQLGKDVGISFQQIQKYEQGTNRISASRLWLICRALRASPNDLYEGLVEGKKAEVTRLSQKVAETAHHLAQIKNADVRHSLMDLILLCETDELRRQP